MSTSDGIIQSTPTEIHKMPSVRRWRCTLPDGTAVPAMVPTGAPHFGQSLKSGCNCVPQLLQNICVLRLGYASRGQEVQPYPSGLERRCATDNCIFLQASSASCNITLLVPRLEVPTPDHYRRT